MIYVITGTLAFAEKAMSPVLLMPSNFAKSISKDSIKFTWQNAQNEANAKVNAYRIIISENAQFNGYTPSTGRCNVTCVTSVINSTTFTTALRSSNKTYYWRVQGLSSIENGEWSRTGTFKTDNGAPTITSASATPSSTSLGNAINFSATLSSALPNNYNVKLNYGTSTVNMTWSGTSYNTSQIPMQLGQQVFTVGVYNSSDALKGTVFKGNFEITKSNSPPILSLIDAATTATVGTSYSVRLQASDVDNNLQSIIMVWGDGVNDTQTAINDKTLTFTHAYTAENSYDWSASAMDSFNVNSSAISKSVTVSVVSNNKVSKKINDTGITACSNETNNSPCPILNFPNQDADFGRDATNNFDSDGHAGFSFTKISGTGSSLPASATSWNCVKDNVTGLMWETKTTDGGLHDQNHTYTWYEPDDTKNGRNVGMQNGGNCRGSQCDTNAYVKAVNSVGYCSYKDWRMPTRQDLTSIIDFSKVGPTIDKNYFQSTKSEWYWSSSPVANDSSVAWSVYFAYGDSSVYYGGSSNHSYKSFNNFVRLVR